MKVRKWLARGFLAGTILTGPVAVLPALVAIFPFNPMLLAFLYPFDVTNDSGETVWITPIGAIGPAGDRRVLPQYTEDGDWIPADRQKHQMLEPGKSVRVVYDWDDVNFSEIIVRNVAGDFRMLVVDAEPTHNQYHSPAADRFVIPSLAVLPAAPRAMVDVVERHSEAWARRLILILAPPLVPIAFFVLWLRTRREAPASPLRPLRPPR